MKTFIPWLCAIAFAAGATYLYIDGGKKDAELATLRPQAADVQNLRTQLEQAQTTATGQIAEIDRLKKESEDAVRLRNDVRQLRDEKTQLAKQLQTAQGANATATQQAEQLRTANQQLQSVRSAAKQTDDALLRDACISRLREIDGVKKVWAATNKKSPQDVPTAQDLAPLLKEGALPVCPAGGTYTLGTVEQPPTCSLPGHAL